MPVLRRHACVALVSLLALASACDDEPSAPRLTTPVTFCTDAPFVAYRNEGEGWKRLLPRDGPLTPLGSVFEFDATARVGLAYAWGDRTLPYLVVEYLSAAQASVARRCDDLGVQPPPQGSTGVVRPWNGVGEVQVAYGPYPYPRIHFGADSVFGLATLESPSDLVAVRGAWTDILRVERMILRRAQHYPRGSRVVLDFAAAEAFALDEQTLHFDGPRTTIEVKFRTAGGQQVHVAGRAVGNSDDPALPREVTIHSVPASRLEPGDLHVVTLEDVLSGGRQRRVELWTREPRDLTMRFGPPASMPTLRTEATSPYVRVTAEIPSQPEYDAGVGIFYDQAPPLNSSVWVRATREYFGGTPATWRLELPDFRGVDGFPVNTGLKVGPLRWALDVANRPGLPWVALGPPTEGLVLRRAAVEGLRP